MLSREHAVPMSPVLDRFSTGELRKASTTNMIGGKVNIPADPLLLSFAVGGNAGKIKDSCYLPTVGL
jgi:hypothetical protein